MTPLRQRYIDDLRLKNFSPGTIKVYVHAVAKFARHFGHSPDTLSGEEIRAYLVQLLDRGVSAKENARWTVGGQGLHTMQLAFQRAASVYRGGVAESESVLHKRHEE